MRALAPTTAHTQYTVQWSDF